MALEHLTTRRFVRTDEAIITPFCLVDATRISSPQPPRPMLRVPQEALGLGGRRAGPVRAVAGHRERALVPA
jgi:hypothetical protein